MWRTIAFPLAVALSLGVGRQDAPKPADGRDRNTLMMDATFRVFGPGDPKDPTLVRTGTGFLMGKPVAGQANRVSFVLVTAAHVLKDILGDSATLVIREHTTDNGYRRREIPFPIRKNGTALWQQSGDADVAAIYVRLPKEVSAVPIPENRLADDTLITSLGIRPGDEIFTIGYPYGIESNTFGFGILRSGRIASLPLVPQQALGSFLADFHVFGGNSGGPVFISQSIRETPNAATAVGSFFCVLGVVVSDRRYSPTQSIDVAGVAFAHFIRQAIDALPDLPTSVGAPAGVGAGGSPRGLAPR